jgi:lipoyl-dependent peroxiredoxin
MALANILSQADHAPGSVAPVLGSSCATSTALSRSPVSTSRVRGLEGQQFREYAEQAKTACRVSRALAGIPEIELTAKLL